MNHEILWDLVLAGFGLSVIITLVGALRKTPLQKFKIPLTFITGALWGGLVTHTFETDNRIQSYIFMALLGIMLLLSANARMWKEEADKPSTGV